MARLTLLLSALALLLCASLAHAQSQAPVYRWTDAHGKVHYGDKASAPRGARPFLMQVAGPASDRQYLSGSVTDASSSDTAPGQSSQEPTPAPSQAQAEEEEAVRQACQVAQRNRNLLADESQNVLNDAGTEVLSPAARAQRLARVEREIDAYCNVLASSGDAP